jgi:polysaccharide biosynthesis protein PslG
VHAAVRAVACLLLTAGVAAAFATPSRASEPGVVTDLTWGTTVLEQDRALAAVRDLGVRWVRLSAQWSILEPAAPGEYDRRWLAHVDRAVRLTRRAGLRTVLTVYDAPVWASGSAAMNVPRHPADFARFMRFLAARYRGRVRAYEIWNEPNLPRFWTSPDAAAYAALLRAAYRGVKAGDRRAKVIFGGLSASDYDFVERAYAAGAKGHFDVMAVHPYTRCGVGAPEESRRREDGRLTSDSFRAYREVRASMLARGDAKPIWLTEFGWSTSTAACDPAAGVWVGGVSERQQADFIRRSYRLLRRDRYVALALVYNLRNNYWEHDADTLEARYGLLRTDFTPKPAYFALRAVARGR